MLIVVQYRKFARSHNPDDDSVSAGPGIYDVSALGCREVGFYCDTWGKHYSQLILPKIWINHANSAAFRLMAQKGKNWDRVTRRVDERAPTVVGGSGVASAEGKKN